MTSQLILIAHNLRSAHNVGSLLRTADGLGVQQVFLTGYTPYPWQAKDNRLPHLARKIDRQIAKTALGAEKLSFWEQAVDVLKVIAGLKANGFMIAALEQDSNAVSLSNFDAPKKLALIVGREVEGIEPELLGKCDVILEIPMLGQKESFNVSVAAGMALYGLRYNH